LTKEKLVLRFNFMSGKEEAAVPIDIEVQIGCFIFDEISAT
jgi:hypothetical protein